MHAGTAKLLALTSSSRSLVAAMLLTRTLRTLPRSSAYTAIRTLSTGAPDIQRLTVFGGGLMGAGIAQVAAQAGLKVAIADLSDQALENRCVQRVLAANERSGVGYFGSRGEVDGLLLTDLGRLARSRNIITKSLTRIARKKSPDDSAAQKQFIDSVFANLSTTTSAQEAIADSDLVIEAIVENLATKQELFRRLDEMAAPETIFASNTSSLSIRRIAEVCSDDRRKRFSGVHAFNPGPSIS